MNAVIYARYSSHSQTEQSIEGQLHDNYEWAAKNGVTVIGEYIDRAQSARTDARTDFQRMIADAAKRQFEMVIVWKLDRFARNRYDSAIYKAKLGKFGVRVVSVKEAITDSPEGIILEGLLEAMNEYYSANLSQNIRRGQDVNIQRGIYNGGVPPFGYKIVNGKLVADERTAPVIQWVFRQYAAGMPMKEIVSTLKAQGVRTSRGNVMERTAFQHAMKNTTYIGQHTFRGQLVDGCAERLIDDDTFRKVQERLEQTKHAPAARKAKIRYLLQGKIFCGHCGAALNGESGKSHTGEIYYYYKCRTRKFEHACKKRNEKKFDLERFIVEKTLQFVLSPAHAQRIASAVVKEYDKEFSDNQIEQLQAQIRALDSDMNKLVDAILRMPVSAQPKIQERMNEIDVRRKDLETELAKLRIASNIRLTEGQVLAWLNQFDRGDPTDTAYQQKVIDTFVNSVYVYDDRIFVFYNIKDGKQTYRLNTEELSSIEDSSPYPTSKVRIKNEMVYVILPNPNQS